MYSTWQSQKLLFFKVRKKCFWCWRKKQEISFPDFKRTSSEILHSSESPSLVKRNEKVNQTIGSKNRPQKSCSVPISSESCSIQESNRNFRTNMNLGFPFWIRTSNFETDILYLEQVSLSFNVCAILKHKFYHFCITEFQLCEGQTKPYKLFFVSPNYRHINV